MLKLEMAHTQKMSKTPASAAERNKRGFRSISNLETYIYIDPRTKCKLKRFIPPVLQRND